MRKALHPAAFEINGHIKRAPDISTQGVDIAARLRQQIGICPAGDKDSADAGFQLCLGIVVADHSGHEHAGTLLPYLRGVRVGLRFWLWRRGCGHGGGGGAWGGRRGLLSWCRTPGEHPDGDTSSSTRCERSPRVPRYPHFGEYHGYKCGYEYCTTHAPRL